MFKKLIKKASSYKQVIRWSLRIFVIGLLIDIGYIWGMMPSWNYYQQGPIAKSSFIRTYENQQSNNKQLPPLQWKSVALSSMNKHIIHAVIVAEDSKFYQHNGIDTEAFKAAMEYNLTTKKMVYGGSTISQQMIKNMLLSPSRNPLRKWHELWLTLALERNVSKQRILEIYLNVAEFGRGIYGVEAASRHYWGKQASQLSKNEAIELTAALTSPIKHNPATRSNYFLTQKKKIMRNMAL
jgi:monofunctional biosynthetic peptidoglycan transglycosylase